MSRVACEIVAHILWLRDNSKYVKKDDRRGIL